MVLSEKVGRSGLDLSGRERPTLALLPRGNWIRHYYYDFPALLGGELDRLVTYGLEVFAQPGRTIPAGQNAHRDRLILAAHSGGGMPAVDALVGAERAPDELYIFDGLYGRDQASAIRLKCRRSIVGWVRPVRCGRTAGRVAGGLFRTADRGSSPARSAAHQAPLGPPDPVLAKALSRRYKIEISGVRADHTTLPARFAGSIRPSSTGSAKAKSGGKDGYRIGRKRCDPGPRQPPLPTRRRAVFGDSALFTEDGTWDTAFGKATGCTAIADSPAA